MNYQKACKILELDTPFTKEQLKKQYHRECILSFIPTSVERKTVKNLEKYKKL